jgi:serine/threonine protein kinase
MNEVTSEAKAIFFEALEHPTLEHLSEFLDRRCKGDAEIRHRVEELLRAHQKAGQFLGGESKVGETADFPSSTEQPGGEIGPYKLLQQIGEGGMGTVFMAQQTRPVTRRVALKIIKPGMDTKAVIARFEAERQALAMMDHPNIAKVLDAGTTESGRPYFVMELVKGVPITDYCDDNRLSARERLMLFRDVCQAVQHAHQKGIIHRDLKPSNVLVAKYDEKPVVKVIDFGVAKAINHELAQHTLFTEFGQVVGTIEYMSPEQAQFNQLDIDTRSDIYSLGVLLYELLTGQPPLERQRLRTAALDEILRIIREEEPPKPSTRISILGRDGTKVSQQRGTDVKGLGRMVRGDVDLIVMMALEKNRERRYQTASDFANDILRFLSGDAIVARPPSTSYRIRKLVSRNRGFFVAATCVCVALSVGMAWALIEKTRAETQKQMTLDAIAGQRHLMREQALLALLGGEEVEAFESLVPDAVALGISSDWIITMQGLQSHLSGDSQKTIEQLTELSPPAREGVLALSLSSIAHAAVGDEDKQYQEMAKLVKLPAHGFEENLLKGLGIYRWLPEEGEACLREANQLRGFSPIARRLLEDARCNLAANGPDRQAGRELTKNSIDVTGALSLLMRDDPQFLATFIHARLQHAHLLALDGDKEGSKKMTDAVQSDVARLSQFPQHESAEWWPPLNALVRGDHKEAFRILQARADAGLKNNNYIIAYLGAICLEDDEFDLDRGIEVMAQASEPNKHNLYGLQLCLELSKSDASERKQDVLRELRSQWEAKRIEGSASSDFFLFIDWTVAKILQEEELARDIGEELYQSALERSLFEEEIACAAFMSGRQSNSTELLNQCRGFGLFTAYAHWVIGFDSLATGDRQDAEQHFAAIVQTGDFQHGLYWWGKAFHTRVKDKAWLPWLTQR